MPKRSLQDSAVVRLFFALWLAITPTFVWAGSMTLLGVGGPAAGGAYVGPGDIQASALAWYGMRAYSAAYATGLGNIADIVDTATGASSCTIKSKSNGDADLSSNLCVGNTVSVTTFCTVTHAAGCSVTKLYDQSGHALHATQSTLANMPQLITGSITGLSASRPGLKMGASVFSQLVSAGNITSTAVPLNISLVAERTGSTTSYQGIIGATNTTGPTPEGVYFNNAINTLMIYAGSGVSDNPTANDNSFNAIQANYFADPNTSAYVNGILTTPGNSIIPITMNGPVTIGTSTTTTTQFVVGFFEEGGIWAGDQTSHNSAMNSNQRTYWGF